MRSILFILLLAFLGLQYKLWLGDGSITQWRILQQKIAVQKQENAAKIARNQAMEAEIVELQSGDQALEEQARYELGMVKNEETYYQFVE